MFIGIMWVFFMIVFVVVFRTKKDVTLWNPDSYDDRCKSELGLNNDYTVFTIYVDVGNWL